MDKITLAITAVGIASNADALQKLNVCSSATAFSWRPFDKYGIEAG